MRFSGSAESAQKAGGYCLGLLMALFLVALLCSVPFYDDFNWYLDGQKNGIIGNTLNSSGGWSSRVVSNFLGSASALFGNLVLAYPLLLLLCSAALYFALRSLIGAVTSATAHHSKRALILFFTIFGLSVHVNDSYFWFAGANSYLIAAALGTWGLASLLKEPGAPIGFGRAIAAPTAITLSILSNESALVFAVATAWVISQRIRTQEGKRRIVLALLGAFVGVVAFVLIPGSRVRGSAVGSISKLGPAYQVVVEGIALGVSVALCGSLLMLIAAASVSAGNSLNLSKLLKKIPLVVTVAVVTCAGSVAPSLLLAGYLPGRVTFLGIAAAVVIVFATAVHSSEEIQEEKSISITPGLLAAIASILLLALPQNLQLLRDLRENLHYSVEQRARFKSLASSTSKGLITLPPVTFKPETLFQSDITSDPTNYINKDLADYFGVKAVVLEPSRPAR